ncbi:MAG: hypothetical protein AB7N76_28420 [Planctomycetota bacterium]
MSPLTLPPEPGALTLRALRASRERSVSPLALEPGALAQREPRARGASVSLGGPRASRSALATVGPTGAHQVDR